MAGKNVSNWCKCLGEVCYTRNISYHSATTTPYEAVFGTKPHWEVSTPATQQVISDDNHDQLEDPDAHLEESTSEIIEWKTTMKHPQTKDKEKGLKSLKTKPNITKKWYVQQSEKKSAKKCNQFKVGDVVSIKIDRVDKTSLFHPNMLLGKITELENQYARVVTKFGRIQTLISPTRLNLCTATNVLFDYTKEITFTSACKQASIMFMLILKIVLMSEIEE